MYYEGLWPGVGIGGPTILPNNLETNKYEVKITAGMDVESKVKENKDKFSQYKFNFKLSEDHYIFDSIEKIN